MSSISEGKPSWVPGNSYTGPQDCPSPQEYTSSAASSPGTKPKPDPIHGGDGAMFIENVVINLTEKLSLEQQNDAIRLIIELVVDARRGILVSLRERCNDLSKSIRTLLDPEDDKVLTKAANAGDVEVVGSPYDKSAPYDLAREIVHDLMISFSPKKQNEIIKLVKERILELRREQMSAMDTEIQNGEELIKELIGK